MIHHSSILTHRSCNRPDDLGKDLLVCALIFLGRLPDGRVNDQNCGGGRLNKAGKGGSNKSQESRRNGKNRRQEPGRQC